MPGPAVAIDQVVFGVGGPIQRAGTVDPSLAPGVAAPIASQYLRSDGSRWAKVGTGDTDWLRSSFFTNTPNGDVVTIQPGMPVVILGATARRGNAASQSLSTVVGFALASAAVTLPVVIVTGAELSLPAATWDAVTGQVGGLTSGVTYWLDVAVGKITVTPPSAAGQSVCVVGRALSATSFFVAPQAPVFL